jgi:hypothetical protein
MLSDVVDVLSVDSSSKAILDAGRARWWSLVIGAKTQANGTGTCPRVHYENSALVSMMRVQDASNLRKT